MRYSLWGWFQKIQDCICRKCAETQLTCWENKCQHLPSVMYQLVKDSQGKKSSKLLSSKMSPSKQHLQLRSCVDVRFGMRHWFAITSCTTVSAYPLQPPCLWMESLHLSHKRGLQTQRCLQTSFEVASFPKCDLLMGNPLHLLSLWTTAPYITLVMDLLKEAKIVVIFLPPYSPDYNPIELVFGYITSYLKHHDELLQALSNLLPVIIAAFENITP